MDRHSADPVQSLTMAGEELDDLGHDLGRDLFEVYKP